MAGTTTTGTTTITKPDRKMTPEECDLVTSNEIVVACSVNAVKNIARSKSDVDDLRGHAWMVLCDAAMNFKPEYGVKFRTYAQRCCTRALRDYVYDCGIITVPSWLRKKSEINNPRQEYARRARGVSGLPCGHDALDYSESSKADIRIDIQLALASMPMERRRWAIDRHLDGWEDKKIAEYLGLTKSMAWRIRKDATEDLRRWFLGERNSA